MRKLFFTIITSVLTLFASAQYMVVTNIEMPDDNESWEINNFTNNLGIGYQLNANVIIGANKNGDNYDVFGRYYLTDMYVSMRVATDSSDDMRVGVGYSFSVGNNIYIEPNYTMSLDNENKEGEFNFGVAYRF